MRPGEAEDIVMLRQWAAAKHSGDRVTSENLRTIVLPRLLDEYERLREVVAKVGQIKWNPDRPCPHDCGQEQGHDGECDGA